MMKVKCASRVSQLLSCRMAYVCRTKNEVYEEKKEKVRGRLSTSRI